jgi:inosine-uridine nucleoside N-ribohydrolase
MVGLDVTHKALLGPAHDERLRSAGCAGTLVAELLEFFNVYHRETYGFDGSPIHDAVAVAQVVRPGIVKTLERNVEVDTESELCRGRTVVDLWHRTGREPNARVGVDIDAEGFLELLLERIASLG